MGLTFTWFGQSGFLLEGDGRRVAIDPFLSENDRRLVPPAAGPADLADVDLILCTHEHGDHLDLPTLKQVVELSDRPRIAVPAPIVPAVEEQGIPRARLISAVDGERLAGTGIRIDVIAAMHGSTMEDAYGFGRSRADAPSRFVGYVVHLGGHGFYHAGDTVRWPDQAETLMRLGADVLALPVNGRDREREERGLVGNLDLDEAWRLACDARASVLVPMHWDCMRGNTVDPRPLLQRVDADGAPRVLIPGRSVRVDLA